MMRPDESTTKPDPRELTLRVGAPDSPPGWSLNRSSKKSRKGDPGGSSGMGTGVWPATFWLVEMLTTEGESLAAMSATDSGPLAPATPLVIASTMRAQADCRQLRSTPDHPNSIIAWPPQSSRDPCSFTDPAVRPCHGVAVGAS